MLTNLHQILVNKVCDMASFKKNFLLSKILNNCGIFYQLQDHVEC